MMVLIILAVFALISFSIFAFKEGYKDREVEMALKELAERTEEYIKEEENILKRRRARIRRQQKCRYRRKQF